MNTELISIQAHGLGFVEGVRRHQSRTWFSDFFARKVFSIGDDNQLRVEAFVPGQPSGIGFDLSGALLVVSVHEGRIYRFAGHDISVLADIGAMYRGGLNDMVTGSDGICYVSAFPPPPVGQVIPDVPPDGGNIPLFMVTPDGKVNVVAEGLKFPNGMAISLDGRELLVAETMANRISTFPLLPGGLLGQRKTFAELGHRMPDGISLDSRGNLWVGSPFTSEFIRIDPAGKVDAEFPVPGRWAVSCAVGENPNELYCGVVETTLDDYKQGKAIGAIERWKLE